MIAGPRCILSENVRIRHPDLFRAGANCILDDFCYISTAIELGDWTHIASCVSIIGGADHALRTGRFCAISVGARIACASSDFRRSIGTLAPGAASIGGDVVFGDHVTVGANAVVLGPNRIPEGVVIGALGFVPPNANLEPWMIYVGNCRPTHARDRDAVLRAAEQVA